MERMAGVVDDQNKGDPLYTAMTDHLESSVAFKAACELVYDGLNQPSGYTEPILHARRLEKKRWALSSNFKGFSVFRNELGATHY